MVTSDEIDTLAERANTDPAAVQDKVEPLIAGMSHDNPAVRETATEAINDLARFDPEASIPAVKPLADRFEDTIEIRRTAIDTVRVISKYHPSALRPIVEDLVSKTVDTEVPINIGMANDALANIHETSPEAVATVVKEQYEILADSATTAEKRSQTASKLAVLSIKDLSLVESVLPYLLHFLKDSNTEVQEEILNVAEAAADAGVYTDTLRGHESVLHEFLSSDNEYDQTKAYDTLAAIGCDVPSDFSKEEYIDDSQHPPLRSLNISRQNLAMVLEKLDTIGATVSTTVPNDAELSFDLRYRLSGDIEYQPTEVVGHLNLVDLLRETEWVNLDACHAYEANEAFVLSYLTLPLGSTPIAIASSLSDGNSNDFLVYIPMEFDWEAETPTPTVFITPDGTVATFDAANETDAVRVLKLVVKQLVEYFSDGSNKPDTSEISQEHFTIETIPTSEV